MRRRTVFSILAMTADACEPILPFMDVVGGPGPLTKSFTVLAAAVALKCVAFALSQKRLPFVKSAGLMLLGNILTTFIGMIAAVMIGSSGGIWFIGIPIVWFLCLLPARRLRRVAPFSWMRAWPPGFIATAMTMALAASCVLFGLSAEFAEPGSMWVYWLVKLAAIYPALIVSILLSALWEEWVVWKLSRAATDDLIFMKPALRANLLVLLIVMIFAAGMMLPKRLKSRDHLIGFYNRFQTRSLNFSDAN